MRANKDKSDLFSFEVLTASSVGRGAVRRLDLPQLPNFVYLQ
jgi:hypothetical protein